MNIDTIKTIENFFGNKHVFTYKKGEYIFRPGDAFSEILFVKSGFVRLFTISPEGKEITIDIFKPLFYFSLIFGITDTVNKYYFEAITPVQLWKTPKREFLDFLKKYPEILLELTKNISSGFKDLLTHIEYLMPGNAYSKTASSLLIFAEKYGEKFEGGTKIYLKFTHNDIAGFTGLTRETISIQMEKLEKEGIISQKEKFIVVPDMTKLECASNQQQSL